MRLYRRRGWIAARTVRLNRSSRGAADPDGATAMEGIVRGANSLVSEAIPIAVAPMQGSGRRLLRRVISPLR